VSRSAIETSQALGDEFVGEVEIDGQTLPSAKFQGVPTPIKQMSGRSGRCPATRAGPSATSTRSRAAEIVGELLGRTTGAA
jgi:hypothetical protein